MSEFRRSICIPAMLALLAMLLLTGCALRPEQRDPVQAAVGDGSAAADRTDGEAVHLLLLGCDRAAALADSILLVRVTPKSGDVRVLQLPRDTYAAYTEKDYRKLNGIYNTLGSAGAKEWLSGALGVQIDCVAVYDLDCVRRAVDAVGGVELEIPISMSYSDPAQGLEIRLPAGTHRLTGEEAEQFIRFRAGYADADLGRLDAQKRFLEAFLHAAHALPVKDLIRACLEILPCVQTDLPTGDAIRLTVALWRAQNPTFSARTAPGEAAKGVSGAWYYVLRREQTEQALAWWSGRQNYEFDPERLFDRPSHPEFHRIYTATDLP